ncbi:carbamoyl phosphate synthase large subunit [Bacillus sp. FJAT-27225]|uniref:carbamoyl-phosphate synthase (glutamine-hydrolyzing) large subunit n=1 Tax=Bacillus sp. FJAT-27225 TaxID=1743144 RepID=UPI00080C31C8|nr:carbamoyl-phosphate synthase (glutamine-hydrolyzing) large subunit [Bacillus sp. FJAT-27225]OCA83312.1 carbamoyl phosphate synthase large subunit [Bacillus sp. FJAT-27225]
MPYYSQLRKVMVIGSGPIVIGQAAEFDYAGTQACIALREEGIEVILVNNNPATIMTDETVADKVYIEPLTVGTLEQIIQKEKPDGIIGTLGGQTGLNLAVQLYEQGILDKYKVELLGTSVESIKNGEDRERFRSLMLSIGEPVPESEIIHSVDEGIAFAKKIGLPVIIRPAYTLGGDGGGFAETEDELEGVLKKGLAASPINQVLVERSIKGWKEIEYEVMRDANDTCIIVCNMENFDPVGVHTGDSIVVAPSQTLTDVQYQLLRDASIKVIRELGVIGGCNIQFALHPTSNDYFIIEVNPRVSRSSALASKATGYPIARIAAKCSVGYHLDEILNPITGNTYASFEPAIDYLVVKLPRFPFDKFPEADRTLGTQMKATGEVMAIDRNFEGALNKAIRSLEMKVWGLKTGLFSNVADAELEQLITIPNDMRLFAISEALHRGVTVERIQALTQIDLWFLHKLETITELEKELASFRWETAPVKLLKEAKRINLSDRLIAETFEIAETEVRQKWKELGISPGYKMVDTCSAEFDAVTPYYYSTWAGGDEAGIGEGKKVAVIGSGPIRIGQGIEFDYCSVHAAFALKKRGYKAIVINNNPETVSTDYSVADRLYFEPLAFEDIMNVIEKEAVERVMIQFGGQTAINLAQNLEAAGVKILGTDVKSIDRLEDRDGFYRLLKELGIPHIDGKIASNAKDALHAAKVLGYPVLVRPSYVIGGQSMFTFYLEEDLEKYLATLDETDTHMWPLLVDRFLPGLECEMDIISDGKTILIPGIFEHLEKAGVHSGDSLSVFPPLAIESVLKKTMVEYATKIAKTLPVIGIMNIQFVIHEGIVFVLEVNPRASRTVPIISKVTGIPLIEWAALVQLGVPLSELHSANGLLEEPPYFTVKAPVFSNGKLKGVDPVLGPEMKSTGEALGLGMSFSEALFKAAQHGERSMNIEGKTVFCSVPDREKDEILEVIRSLHKIGANIVATKGTFKFLIENGVPASVYSSDSKALEQLFREGKVDAVINIPSQGRKPGTFGFALRQLAVRYNLPCFTHIDTLTSFLKLNKEAYSSSNTTVRTIQDLHGLKDKMIAN